MVFSSFPVYLDHPNLHQLQQPEAHQQAGNPGLENPQLPALQPPSVLVGASPGSIRPGSMVDRARLAKIPLPEAGLKCPRCDSTNTKFCYFNNYNLSQPRHFCKTCRRYWTRGGALRSVPVGGGCRRNKRSKSSNNNSSKTVGSNVNSTTAERQIGTASGPSTSASPSRCNTEIITGRQQFPHEQSPVQLTPLMAAFQNLNHHYGGFQPPSLVSTHNSNALGHHEMGFQIGSTTNHTNNLSVGSDHQWRLPSLAVNTNLYPFHQGEGIEASSGNNIAHDGDQGLNSTKQFLGTMENNNQYWGGNAWTGFSGLNSSSASHIL
ncbi:unnamed protein product [Withania somnifera]